MGFRLSLITLLLFMFLLGTQVHSQELYTARGYWVESTKETYRKLKEKQIQGIQLTADETNYLQDYETYLGNYYQRLSDAEKVKYEQMKAEWDRSLAITAPERGESDEFDWKPRDRAANGFYGLLYGTSLVIAADIDGAAAAGIPLITGGLWMLGPVINPKKYEGINRSALLAGNTGKSLGLIYGGSLGLMVGGESDYPEKAIFGFASLGSIALGEVGFQLQKKKNFTEGHISMIRHYGILGPWVGLSIFFASGSESAALAGTALLAGGAGGILAGNKASKNYSYTRGDVDAISSLTWISTGIGFALVANAFENDDPSDAIILVPAAASIAGTLLGQKMLREAQLTKKQGSAINLAAGGAALVGFGVVAITESESPWVWFGVPSALALVTHQLVLHKYKQDNITKRLQGSLSRKHDFKLSMNVMPENYFINKQMPAREYAPNTQSLLSNPIVKLKVSF